MLVERTLHTARAPPHYVDSLRVFLQGGQVGHFSFLPIALDAPDLKLQSAIIISIELLLLLPPTRTLQSPPAVASLPLP